MKRSILSLFLLLAILLTGCVSPTGTPTETAAPPETTLPTEIPPEPQTEAPATTAATEETTLPPPVPVVELTEEEQTMLLKIGMAERGESGCTQCIALVMRTVLNRVEADRFGSSVRSVLFAQDQFTPVADGSYYAAEPNEHCLEALDMVIYGWDESQGALYYEWCEGESWHSQNLHLLFQHCDTRFYD